MASDGDANVFGAFLDSIRKSVSNGCDSVFGGSDFFETDVDVTLYENRSVSLHLEKVKQCAIDALAVIRSSVPSATLAAGADLTQTEAEICLVVYPLCKTALDCLINQLDGVLEGLKKHPNAHASTITLEGLFLVVKTSFEVLNPNIYCSELGLLEQLVKLLEKVKDVYYLARSCMGCIAVYVCRCFTHGLSKRLIDSIQPFMAVQTRLYDLLLDILLTDGAASPDALLLLRRITSYIFMTLTVLSDGPSGVVPEAFDSEKICFMARLVDNWYGALVRRIVNLRSRIRYGGKHQQLCVLLNLLQKFPPLPTAHRLRLVLTVALCLNVEADPVVYVHALGALTWLLDFDDDANSKALRANLHNLTGPLLALLLNKRLAGASMGAKRHSNVNAQIALLYCIAQCIRTHRRVATLIESTPDEPIDEDLKDGFLKEQIKQLLPASAKSAAEMDSSGAGEHNTAHGIIYNDCVLLTRLVELFRSLLAYKNEELEETMALVACWLLREFEFELAFKLLVPILLEFLRTKRNRMIDSMYTKSPVLQGSAALARFTAFRWVMGGRIFLTALEIIKEGTFGELSAVSRHLVDQLFEATVDILLESQGKANNFLESCFGKYVAMYGIEFYLKSCPLNKMSNIPITTPTYHMDASVFMLAVLKRQLRGHPVRVFTKHFLPVAREICKLSSKTREMTNVDQSVDFAALASEYDNILAQINDVLVALVANDPKVHSGLLEDDSELLRWIVGLLDLNTPTYAILACKVIANVCDFGDLGPRMVGLAVKLFIALEQQSTGVSTSNLALEDALLAAISNCSRFCPSEMLSHNLKSFQEAVASNNQGATSMSVVKVARAIFPCVQDSLKTVLFNGWLSMLKENPDNKILLVAVKRGLEHMRNQARTCSSTDELPSFASIGANFPFVESMAKMLQIVVDSPDTSNAGGEGDGVSAEALRAKGDAAKNFGAEMTRHQIGAVCTFVEYIVALKACQKLDPQILNHIKEVLFKPLIFECIVGSQASNSYSRSSAAVLFDSLVELQDGELGPVLKLLVSGLACGNYASMQTGIVKCLARLVAAYPIKVIQYDLAPLLRFIFGLLGDAQLKLFIQLLKFARICIVVFDHNQTLWLAPLLVPAFKNNNAFRARIYLKRMVAKLIVKLTRHEISCIIPREHMPLVRNIVICKRRLQQNKALNKSLKLQDKPEETDEQVLKKLFKRDDNGRLTYEYEEEMNYDDRDAADADADDGESQGAKRLRRRRRRRDEDDIDVDGYEDDYDYDYDGGAGYRFGGSANSRGSRAKASTSRKKKKQSAAAISSSSSSALVYKRNSAYIKLGRGNLKVVKSIVRGRG